MKKTIRRVLRYFYTRRDVARTIIGIYYSDLEGKYPLANIPDGYASNSGTSLSSALTPRYIEKLPVPILTDRMGSYNGVGTSYDLDAVRRMNFIPLPHDVVVLRGPAGPTPLITRPYVYDPDRGFIYLCNGNYDTSGSQRFFEW